jgi:hypothetical protein
VKQGKAYYYIKKQKKQISWSRGQGGAKTYKVINVVKNQIAVDNLAVDKPQGVYSYIEIVHKVLIDNVITESCKFTANNR